MSKSYSFGQESQQSSATTRYTIQGAEIFSSPFSEDNKALLRTTLFEWVDLNRKKLVAFVYSCGKSKITWAEAEELVSNLVVDIQLGHFYGLLLKEGLTCTCEITDEGIGEKITGCIYRRLKQHLITLIRWKQAQRRDWKLSQSLDAMLPSSLERDTLDEFYRPSPCVQLQENERLDSFRKYLSVIKTAAYPHLDKRDQAILDAMERIPPGKKINSTSIYEAMTPDEIMLFVDRSKKPLEIDEKKIKLAIYKRRQKLDERILVHIKGGRPSF